MESEFVLLDYKLRHVPHSAAGQPSVVGRRSRYTTNAVYVTTVNNA